MPQTPYHVKLSDGSEYDVVTNGEPPTIEDLEAYLKSNPSRPFVGPRKPQGGSLNQTGGVSPGAASKPKLEIGGKQADLIGQPNPKANPFGSLLSGGAKGFVSGLEGLPGGQHVGLRMPTSDAWSPFTLRPNTVGPDEQTGAMAGQLAGGALANIAPYLSPITAPAGPAVNALYASEQERNRQLDQLASGQRKESESPAEGGFWGNKARWGIGGQGLAGAAIGKLTLPNAAAASTDPLKRFLAGALVGAGAGAVVGATGPAIEQLTDTGKVSLTPEMVHSMALNAGIMGLTHGALTAGRGPRFIPGANATVEDIAAAPKEAQVGTPADKSPLEADANEEHWQPRLPGMTRPNLPTDGVGFPNARWTPEYRGTIGDLKRQYPNLEIDNQTGRMLTPEELAGMKSLAGPPPPQAEVGTPEQPLGKAAADIQNRRVNPAGSLPPGMTDRRMEDLLVNKFGGRQGVGSAVGGVSPGLVSQLAAGSIGGALGYKEDKEHPLRGALMGAGAGMLGTHLLLNSPQFATAIKNFAQNWNGGFGPTSEFGVEGKAAKSISVEAEGQGARRLALLEQSLNAVRPAIDALPEPQKLAFIDAFEDKSRPINTLPPTLQPAAKAIRDGFQQLYGEIRVRGGLPQVDQFDEHWFGRKWKNAGQNIAMAPQPGGIETALGIENAGRGGGAGFTKPRTFSKMADGIAAGLTPETTNPIDMALLKQQEMNRWIVQQDMRRVLLREGLAVQLGPNSGREPSGWLRDPTDRTGNTFLHPGAAAAVNTMMAPSITDAGGPLGSTGARLASIAKTVAQKAVMARLALSGFHGLTTSMHAGGVKAGNAYKQLINSQDVLGALSQLIRVPTAPAEYWLKGNKFLKDQYLNPSAPMTQELQDYMTSGARGGIDPWYRGQAPQQFRAIMSQKGGGLYGAAEAAMERPFQAASAAFEAPTMGLMNKFVQPIKAGIQLERNAANRDMTVPGAAPRIMRAALQEGERATSDQMGMMTYGNRQIPRAVKDLAMITTTAPGWNYGTASSFLGGVKDLATMRSRYQRGLPPLSDRSAFLLGLPTAVAGADLAYQYAKTGQGPTNRLDFIAPKSGQTNAEGDPERVILPNYLSRDVMSFMHSPVGTIASKFNVGAEEISQLAQNKDWRGTQIYDPSADAPTITKQIATYLGRENLPISIQQAMGRGARQRVGKDYETKAEESVGITAAPKWLTRSPAIQTAMELQARHFPQTHTLSEQDRIDAKQTAKLAERTGNMAPVGDLLAQQKLNPQDVLNIAKSLPATSRLQALTRGLQPEELLQVYQRSTGADKLLLKTELARALQPIGANGRPKAPLAPSLRARIQAELGKP